MSQSKLLIASEVTTSEVIYEKKNSVLLDSLEYCMCGGVQCNLVAKRLTLVCSKVSVVHAWKEFVEYMTIVIHVHL